MALFSKMKSALDDEKAIPLLGTAVPCHGGAIPLDPAFRGNNLAAAMADYFGMTAQAFSGDVTTTGWGETIPGPDVLVTPDSLVPFSITNVNKIYDL